MKSTNKKLWGGRFSNHTHPEVDLFNASIQFDAELAYEDILGSLAHVVMLGHCNILTAEETQKIQQGLLAIAKKVMADEIVFRIEDEDIHMNIERLLHEEIGEVAGKLHTARSRNDQVALDIHLYLRKQIIEIVALLAELQTTFLMLSQENRHVILPGYTHLQRAQPVYFAQHCLAYVAMLQRDIARLQEGWQRVNICPLGAGALAGSSFPTDKSYVASLLAFDGVYLNTMDAVSDRDFIVEFLASSALIMMHISRLSEELILWSSQEFNFISLDDAFSTGSSIMPQKKNPDVAELGRGKTGRVYGSLFTLLTILKGLPLAYNKDLQEDKEPLFDTVKTLRMTLSIYSPLLQTLKVNAEVMRSATEHGFLNATVLAEYFVKKGMAFRVAHEIVGKLVALCIQKQCRIEDLTLTEMQQFSTNIDEDVYQVLAVENIVAYQDASIAAQLEMQSKQVQMTQTWVTEKKNLLSAVNAKIGLETPL